MTSMNRLRAAARLSLLCLAPLAMASLVVAQRAGTVTKTKRGAPSTKGMTVEQRVDALEKRVEELEKSIDEFELGADTESARDKKLEERLAAIERAQKSGRGGSTAPDQTADDDQPLTVRAPFVVMDEAGKTLFRLEKSPVSGKARLIVGNPIGSRIAIGALKDDGASIQLFDNANVQRIALGVAGGEALLKLEDKKFKVMLTASGSEGNTVSLFTGDVVSARMASGPGGNGRMVLSSGAGATMVEAGSADGLGLVRTGPRVGGSPGSLTGLPFAIMGKKGGE